MSDTDDLIELLQCISRGEEEAYKRFYDKTSPRIFGLALKILKRREWAEDVTQETYVRVWYHAGEYHSGRGSVMTWLISICRNLAIDKFRSRSAKEAEGGLDPDLLISHQDGPELSIVGFQSNVLLQGCIEELSESQRTSILLSFIEGLSHQQVTVRMGKPLGTVKSWVRRGLQSLRRCLQQ